MFCTILTSVAWSQKLHVTSTGHVTITPTAFVFAGGDVEVEAGGSITAESNATNSSSFFAPNGTGNVVGNLTYKRYVTGGSDLSTNWHIVSAPFSGQTIGAFITDDASNDITQSGTTDNYAVAYYNNANNVGERWVYHNASVTSANQANLTNVAFESSRGYSMHRDAVGTYSFVGTMATANDEEFTLVAGASGSWDWNAIGNPFPSHLSTASLFANNTAVLESNHNALYIWDHTSPDQGVGSHRYVVNNNATLATTQLHPGQAFVVKAASNGSVFRFAEGLQNIQDATSTFNRTEAVPTLDVSLSNGSQTSKTMLKYFPNTTSGLDIGWDAGTFRDGTPSLSIDTHLINDSQGVDFMLQCLSDSNYEANIVPLSVKASAGEEITFNAVATNLPSDINVYVEDKINNTIEKINDASYTVTLTDAVNGIGYFYLHTSRTALSIDNTNVLNTVNLYKTSNSNLRITGLQEEGKASVKMYSLTGQEVLEHSFTMQRVNDVTLPSLKTGVYLVQVVSENGKYTKKLIIE
ncbi:MAG: T9SS type A sorting domain-containing protein [Polaribacter sp.]